MRSLAHLAVAVSFAFASESCAKRLQRSWYENPFVGTREYGGLVVANLIRGWR